MKKILVLLLAVLLCFSFCGCSKFEDSIALKRAEKLIVGQWGHIGTEENRNDKSCYEYIYFNKYGGVEKYIGNVSYKDLEVPEYYWKGSEQETNPFYYYKGNWGEQLMLSILY